MRQKKSTWPIFLTIISFVASPLSIWPSIQHAEKQSPEAVMRQSLALTVLDGVLDEQAKIDDVSTRVELAEKLVSLLAKRNPERCRELLNSLFDAVMAQLREAEASRSSESHKSNLTQSLHKLIQIATVFDKKLAETYIRKYSEALRHTEENSNKPTRAAAAAYLHLARTLLDKNPSLAAAVAEMSLAGGIGPETLVFIEMLRAKDANLADKFVLSSLGSIRAMEGPYVDVNELLLLYSYVFSPLAVPVMTPQGLAIYQIPELQGLKREQLVNRLLARQYLELSAAIMLDPARHTSNSESSVSTLMGDFCFLRLIEPQAREYLPGIAPRLLDQENLALSSLGPERAAEVQSAPGSMQNASRRQSDSPADEASSLEAMLRRVEELSDSPERDRLCFEAASLAIRLKKYSLALQVVDKISTKNLSAARQLITFNISLARVQSGEYDEAERLAERDDDLTRRAYVFNLIAYSLVNGAKKEPERASSLLNEVTRVTPKLNNDRERVATLLGAAVVYSYFDQVRAVDTFREAVKSANKLNDFTGDTSIDRSFEISGFTFAYRMYDRQFTFTDLVHRQGVADFSLALSEVRNIEFRPTRLRALIALCNAILS